MDKVNEYLRRTRKMEKWYVRPAMKCADGFSISVQASDYHYCSPRTMDADRYENVELGFPNMKEPLIAEFAEDPEELRHTVYFHVPIEVVNELIEKHGGIVN